MLFKRDWYVVETRTCLNKKHCRVAFLDLGTSSFTRATAEQQGFEIQGNNLFHKEGQISIHQYVFGDIKAALLYFDQAKNLHMGYGIYHKSYIWRISARFKFTAKIPPPNSYSKQDGVILKTYPEKSYSDS